MQTVDAQGLAGRGERARQPRAAHRAGGHRARRRRGSPRRGASIATRVGNTLDVHGERRPGALLPAGPRLEFPTSTRTCSSISAATMNQARRRARDLARRADAVPAGDGRRSPKEHGAMIIAITQPRTPLAELADVVLPVVVPADPSMRVGTEAYLAQMAYLEILMVRHRLAPRPACVAPVEARARRCCRSAASTAKPHPVLRAGAGPTREGAAVMSERHGSRARCCGAARSSTAAARRASPPTCASRASASPRSARTWRRRTPTCIDAARQDRRAGLHRRAHARRPDRAVRAADAAEDQPGRHHRRRRQLRHQPGAAGACRRAAAAQPARRRRQVRLSDDGRVRRGGRRGRGPRSTSRRWSGIRRCASRRWTILTVPPRRPSNRGWSSCCAKAWTPARRG